MRYDLARARDGSEVFYKGYFPISSLPGPWRDLLGHIEAEGTPEDVLTHIRQGILTDIERYRDGEGNFIVHYDSDVTTMYDPGTPREWEYGELRTTVDATGDVQQQTFLDQPMRSPKPSALINATGIIPEAYHQLDHGVNCAIYQLSKHLGIEYATIEEDMRRRHERLYGSELVVTPRTLILWCAANGIGCCFFVANQLHARERRGTRAIAFCWHDNHCSLRERVLV